MNKCCYGMITILNFLVNLKLCWGLDPFCHLCSCAINTFGRFTTLNSSTGLSTNLSTSKFPQIIFNVTNGVCYFFLETMCQKNKRFPLSLTLMFQSKHQFYIYVFIFLSKKRITSFIFEIQTSKKQGLNKYKRIYVQ